MILACEASNDVGMMSQESHVSVRDMISTYDDSEMGMNIFPWPDAEQDDEDGNNSYSFEPEGGNNNPSTHGRVQVGNTGHDSASEADMPPNEFIREMKEELQILEGLIHSRDFAPSYINMRVCLQGLQETNRLIRAKMAEAVNHNRGQEWVSTNVARISSSKRQKGSEFGLTKFI